MIGLWLWCIRVLLVSGFGGLGFGRFRVLVVYGLEIGGAWWMGRV